MLKILRTVWKLCFGKTTEPDKVTKEQDPEDPAPPERRVCRPHRRRGAIVLNKNNFDILENTKGEHILSITQNAPDPKNSMYMFAIHYTAPYDESGLYLGWAGAKMKFHGGIETTHNRHHFYDMMNLENEQEGYFYIIREGEKKHYNPTLEMLLEKEDQRNHKYPLPKNYRADLFCVEIIRGAYIESSIPAVLTILYHRSKLRLPNELVRTLKGYLY